MQYMLQQQQSQQRTDSAIQNLERQIGQLASSLNQMQAQGSNQLPSQTTLNPKGNVSALTLRSRRRVSEFLSEETAVGKFPEIQQQSSSSEEIQKPKNVPISSLIPISIDPLNLEDAQGSRNYLPNSSKSGNSRYHNLVQKDSEPSIPLPFPQQKIQPRKNDLCVHKKKLKGNELISMGKNISALLQPVPQKCEDPGMFTVPCKIRSSLFKDAMLDLGASINVMPRSVFQTLGIGPLQPTGVVIQLADRSQTHPAGVIEDVLVKVRELIFPADFYILDMEGDYLASRSPLILGRPFLKIARTKIDVHAGTLSMEIGDTAVQFIIDSDSDSAEVGQGDILFTDVEDISALGVDDRTCGLYPSERDNLFVGDCLGEALSLGSHRGEELCVRDCLGEALPLGSPSVDQTQYELKPLPQHLKYAYLEENQQLPVIIAQNLEPEQESRFLEILRQHRRAIGWTLADIPGINPSICMHRIYLEEDVKPVRQPQRRLNPLILDVVKKEICIDPEDQEKTTFTCPFGHIVSRRGIEVDPAKVSAIFSLSYPAYVRDIRAFLGHAGFCKRFIRDFSKIALPLSQLLQKDVAFQFD
ncbi:uncharacterized protein LOC122013919 [Zingiber officinale]|uniref:uncharacterized protein LOC122013919 n=1 Tax=Zingiber officinale TaxID=94328 RepID=UPI001C4C7966|nr:uncharacterized protein LOC122013919 [Zingiber officinale]